MKYCFYCKRPVSDGAIAIRSYLFPRVFCAHQNCKDQSDRLFSEASFKGIIESFPCYERPSPEQVFQEVKDKVCSPLDAVDPESLKTDAI